MSTADGIVRVGLIGYGYVAKTFHAPMITATPGLDLVAVASSRAGDVHADHPGVDVVDADRLIARADVDLVVIASPNDTHRPLAEAALTAGHHVVVDKPFALSLEDARAVVATADRCQRIVSVFQNRRWDSDYLGIRQVIDGGLIGEVVHFESHIARFRPSPRDRWRENPGPGAGLWFDLGPHLADQLVVPMAQAGGGSFVTMRPTAHTTTNISVIEKFLPVEFEVKQIDGKNRWRIAVVS